MKIEVVDESTLKLTFTTAVYPVSLCDRTMFPINQAFFENAGDSYGSSAETWLSNGPFMVDSWAEDRLVLKKNPAYWDADSIHLDSITMIFDAMNDTGVDMMLAGEIQMAPINSANQITAMTDAGYSIADVYGGYEYIYINHQGKNEETAAFLQNQNFRLALSTALDRTALCNSIFTAYTPADRLIDDNERGINDTFVNEYPYTGWSTTADVEAAQAYMDKALEELGKTAEDIPTFTFLTFAGTDSANMVSAIGDMWGKIGVSVEYDGQEFQGYVTKAYSSDFDFVDCGTENSAVDWFEAQGKYFLSPASALPYYESEEYDALAANVTGAADWTARKDALFELEKFVTEQALVFDVANIDMVYACDPSITGIYTTNVLDLTYADIQ